MKLAYVTLLCVAFTACGGGSSASRAPNLQPQAIINSNFDGALAPTSIRFDSSESIDPDGLIERVEWRLSDGSKSNDRVVVEEFPLAGSYTVELTVTDNLGAVDSTNFTVEIDSPIGVLNAVYLLLQDEL